MGSSQFEFKQFSIQQDRCAMKVGTDGVLLGAWADLKGRESILDIGTGTGLLALMCAQRNDLAFIQAIEIDASSAAQAKENVSASIFSSRINVLQVSLQNFRTAQKFEAAICNPPFFDGGTQPDLLSRSRARHQVSLTIEELLLHAKRLLHDDAELHLILPESRREEFLKVSAENAWYPKRLTHVYPNPSKSSKRILVTCTRSKVEMRVKHLTIEGSDRFEYTSDYIELTRAFYMKM